MLDWGEIAFEPVIGKRGLSLWMQNHSFTKQDSLELVHPSWGRTREQVVLWTAS